MKKVIVIGAGPAGLTAAIELLKKSPDYKITILEQSNYIGGLSKTIVHNGNRIDIGGHRFFSKSDKIMNWWMNFFPVKDPANKLVLKYQGSQYILDGGITNQLQRNGHQYHPDNNLPKTEDEIMLVRKRVSRILFRHQLFEYPVRLSFSTFKKFGLRLSCRVMMSYLKQKFIFSPGPPAHLEDFMIKKFGKVLYEQFFKTYTEKVWGRPCKEISAEWGVQRIKGVSLRTMAKNHFQQLFFTPKDIWQKKKETSLIEYFLYPKLGPGSMWEKVARQAIQLGCEIKMNEGVSKITSTYKTITNVETVDSKTGEKKAYDADVVFSSMPVQELIGAVDHPPAEVQKIASELEYRAFITIGVLVNKLKMPALKNDTWLYIQEPHVKIGRLQLFNNWSPALVADPAMFWLGAEYFCSVDDELWKQTDEAIRQLAIKELAEIGVICEADVEDALVVREPKAYPGYFGSYNKFTEIKNYLDGIQNLYPIGRNGMHKYNNQDHSMLAAMEAVDIYHNQQKDKSVLWSINSEEEYNEQK